MMASCFPSSQRAPSEIAEEQRVLRRTLEELTNRIRRRSADTNPCKDEEGKEESSPPRAVPEPAPPTEQVSQPKPAAPLTTTVEEDAGLGSLSPAPAPEKALLLRDEHKTVHPHAAPEEAPAVSPGEPAEHGGMGREKRDGDQTAPKTPSDGAPNRNWAGDGKQWQGEEEKGNNELDPGQVEQKEAASAVIGGRNDGEVDLVPVRDQGAGVKPHKRTRASEVSEVLARHERDLEFVRRLGREIDWHSHATTTAAAGNGGVTTGGGLNFIDAVRRKERAGEEGLMARLAVSGEKKEGGGEDDLSISVSVGEGGSGKANTQSSSASASTSKASSSSHRRPRGQKDAAAGGRAENKKLQNEEDGGAAEEETGKRRKSSSSVNGAAAAAKGEDEEPNDQRGLVSGKRHCRSSSVRENLFLHYVSVSFLFDTGRGGLAGGRRVIPVM